MSKKYYFSSSNAYIKSLLREIRQSLGRFLSIFAITALGIGFLAGIMQATPDMRYSLDHYYNNNKLMDISIKATMGLTDEDLEYISAMDEVKDVMPAYVYDVMMDTQEDTSLVTRVYGLSEENMEDGCANRLTLIEGRLPQTNKECLVQKAIGQLSQPRIGSTLTISGDNGSEINGVYSQDKYTVVGVVENPLYISIESEQSSIGSGHLDAVAYIMDSAYSLSAYTDFYITLSKEKKLTSLTSKYDDYIDDFVHKLNNVASDRCSLRYEQLLNQAKADSLYSSSYANQLQYPQWYILTRGSTASYTSLSTNIQKVEEIAKVFPVFFILVVALVALTTMTRMIEEERIQIGTLKALGYSTYAIMYRYIIYCGLSTLLGSLVGLICGFQLLPRVLYNAYSSMYLLPPLSTLFNWSFSAIACTAAILCTTAATCLACSHSLKERPSQLMLPLSPKPGKRILLEKASFLWKKLSFNYKATARNLFRYKKHFFMTIIGIAGCTALMLTGFGLKDSLNCIAHRQYDSLFKYDLTIGLKDNYNIQELSEKLDSPSVNAIDYCQLHIETACLNSHKKNISINLYVFDENSPITEFINLTDRRSGESLYFSQNSVIITEKLSKVMEVSKGDTLSIQNKEGDSKDFIVTGITENYVGSYIYMGADAYDNAYNTPCKNNSILAATGLNTDEKRDKAAQLLLSDSSVSGLRFASQTRGSFENLLSSINYIVAVIIIAAGALAVIVLYNLTNININERRRELAALKVLGFYEKEVAGYIYREITILTIIGTIIGLGLGVLLHSYVIIKAESTDLMFGRVISPLSFLLASAFTLVFSGFVDLIMYKKLKNIEMVDSMKAVD